MFIIILAILISLFLKFKVLYVILIKFNNHFSFIFHIIL